MHEHDALRRDARLLEDLGEVLDGVPSEARARREVPVNVLDLLLALLHRLRDVRRNRVGGGDVHEKGHALLLRDRHHRVGRAGVEGAEQHLGALADGALGLDAPVLGLGLRVAEQQLELEATLGLDAAGGVDRVRRHLRPEAAGLPGLGERAGHRMDRADLERLRLRAERQREAEHGRAGRGGSEERATAQSGLRH